MSSKSDSSGDAHSIQRLRKLRQKLCSSQEEWSKTLKIKDFIICELNCLHTMLEDESISRESCLEKSKEILDNFPFNGDKV